LNRSFVSALLSLTFVSAFPALAQTSGSTQPFVALSVSANPTANGVALTGTVQPETPGSVPHPTGTLTFLDGTTVLNANGSVLTANLGFLSEAFDQVFGTPDTGLASVAKGELVGDFDGDGKDDLLVYGTADASASTEVQAFLSSKAGQDNFGVVAPQTLTAPLFTYLTPAVLDVDGDGKLDLLIGNTVAYGNGDGTFSRVAVLPVLATGFSQTYAVDVNGDDKVDIVAVNTPPEPITTPGTVQFTFTIFRNDGKGTFTSLGSFPLAPSFQTGAGCCALYNIFGLSFADVNGDGNLDVLSQSNEAPEGNAGAPNQLNVVLNNGDGIFGTVKPVDTSALANLTADGAAFGDLNGDGKQDLVAAFATNTGANFVVAALGNGDGTFGSFFQLKLIEFMTAGIPNPQVQLMDFNSDGKLDAILGSGELALGNGDGTFTLSTPLFPQLANPQVPLNYPLVQMPIYAHSSPSLVYLSQYLANVVFTPQNSSSATANVPLSAGTHTLTAQYSGDSAYAAGISSPVTITVAPAATTITLTSSASTIYATQSVTFTATLNNPAANGTVTFRDAYPGSDPLQPILDPNARTLGTATAANGVATLTTNQLPAGIHTITAVYGDVYNPGATAQLTETVNMPFSVANSGQEISLSAGSGKSTSTQINISALGGISGLVMFGCYGLPAACSFSPATVNLAGTGASTVTLTVTATRAPTIGQLSPGFTQTILACGIPFFALFGIASAVRRRALFAVVAIVLCGISCLGCGGGGQQASSASSASLPAGTYPFYVTATSGQNELAINAVLTVQ
jgi:hypothetical protein